MVKKIFTIVTTIKLKLIKKFKFNEKWLFLLKHYYKNEIIPRNEIIIRNSTKKILTIPCHIYICLYIHKHIYS